MTRRYRPSRRTVLAALASTLPIAAMSGSATGAAPITDVLGRRVAVEVPVRRILLGEARQIHAIAALDRENPFARIVGWGDDLEKADPDSYRVYAERYPQIATLPKFGSAAAGGFDLEKAIALQPDVLILNYEAERASAETQLVEKLASVGIAVLYVDFRHAPLRNTEPSLRLLGRLLGREAIAEQLIAFREEQIAKVTGPIAAAQGLKRPLVMLDRIPGYSDACCMSFGKENFGLLVEMAGGRNLGSELLPGTFGTINPETIVARDPEVVIVTGGNWDMLAPGGAWVGLGPGADLAEARRKLAALAQRPAFAHGQAVAAKRVYAIWHQFYNSPYQFAALQCIARWLHPALFADLDPDVTLRTLHERFLPTPYRPGYWTQLEDFLPAAPKSPE
ncbi:ABC transporter substrate-binding protein [Bosea sp. Root381]|uniref:ABC transporter substrate-binding protein n=1 Tax=Bosea sp. Root381 TaxID=1736524 RepID=UPI0006F1F1BC|nr:ABC transporter substrate-binding protein [Bosea sp. Root381]KRE09720.1 ABC transporter substrate-binding protein [Bosea sp. Root381]